MFKRVLLLSLIVSFGGCASSSGSDSAQAGNSASGGRPASAGSGSGLAGQISGSGGLVQGTSGGSPAAGGMTAVAGASESGSVAGLGGGSGGAGQAGQSAVAGSAGSGATAGAPSGHGSAAKGICTPGATYGDPVSGMGTVTTIAAPASDQFSFTEGTIWVAGLSTLFFSDNASSPERIFKLVPPSTTPMLFISNSGSNGLAVDNSDRLVAADQRNKRIVRFDPMTGKIVGAPVSTGAAKPNDVIVRSDDNVYFTDPDSGFYQISPFGTVSPAMKLKTSSRPNGIEFSLDEGTLYVGDVGNRTIAKYPLAADGTVMTTAGANFVSQAMHDLVDGMCIDCAGNIYAGTSGGVEVYAPDGKYLGIVPTGFSSNCTFGGAERKTLYVASRTVLKSVVLNVPGLPD